MALSRCASAELVNADPLNPPDGAQFATDFAFSVPNPSCDGGGSQTGHSWDRKVTESPKREESRPEAAPYVGNREWRSSVSPALTSVTAERSLLIAVALMLVLTEALLKQSSVERGVRGWSMGDPGRNSG